MELKSIWEVQSKAKTKTKKKPNQPHSFPLLMDPCPKIQVYRLRKRAFDSKSEGTSRKLALKKKNLISNVLFCSLQKPCQPLQALPVALNPIKEWNKPAQPTSDSVWRGGGGRRKPPPQISVQASKVLRSHHHLPLWVQFVNWSMLTTGCSSAISEV